MASQAIRFETPLLDQWFEDNYTDFRDYALRNLPSMVPDDQRENIVNDMCIKMMTSDKYESYLAAGKPLAFGSILRFALRNHTNLLHKSAQDALSRRFGARTRSEVDKGEDIIITHSIGLTAVPTYEDEDATVTGYDYVDQDTPTPLETLEVEEMLESVKKGMSIEWDNDPLEVRLKVLELLLNEGSRQEMEQVLGVGPTRAKVLRSEVREVVSHRIKIQERRTDRILRRPRDMTKSARMLKKVLPTTAFDTRSENGMSLETSDVPQSDRLLLVLPRLRQLMGDENIEIGLSKRHIQYLDHSLKILGVIDADGSVTELGVAAVESKADAKSVLQELITSSRVGQVWLRHTGCTSIKHIPPETVTTLLDNRSNLAPSTAKRRGRTLKRWLNFFKIGQ